MKTKGILAILAILALMLGATAVSAIENSDIVAADDENGEDEDIESPYQDGNLTPNEQEAADAENSANDDDAPLVGDNPYRHGALTPNEKAAIEDANAAGGNAEKATSTVADSNSTGNPLLVLVAAIAIIGTTLFKRRK